MSVGWIKEFAGGALPIRLVVDDVETVPRDEFIVTLERHARVIQDNMPALTTCGDDPSKWKRSIQIAETTMRRLKNYSQTVEAGVCNINIEGLPKSIYFLNINDFNVGVGDELKEAYFFFPIKGINFVEKGFIRKKQRYELSYADHPIGFIASTPSGAKGKRPQVPRGPAGAPSGDETEAYGPIACPACGRDNRPIAKFCAGCGARLGRGR